MTIKIPKKVGKEKVVTNIFGKSLINKIYQNQKTGEKYSWGVFHHERKSSFILPITPDNKVIAIRQFRHGANEIILELPVGNIDNETPEKAAKRELLEETGYLPGRTISLSDNKKVWVDPANADFYFYPFLCLDCTLQGKQKLDENEDIEIELIDLRAWIDLIYKTRVNSPYAMLTTLLALPRLQALKIFRRS